MTDVPFDTAAYLLPINGPSITARGGVLESNSGAPPAPPTPGLATVLAINIPTTTLTGTTVITSGYYTIGDIGTGATYSSSGATLNGPMAVRDASGTLFNLVIINGVYNVGQWGAKGDGTTDDGPAIRAAVAFAYNACTLKVPGAEIFFPAGLYINSFASSTTNIMGAITALNPRPPGGAAGLTFRGIGRLASRLRMDTTAANNLVVPSISSIVLSGTVATVTFSSSVDQVLVAGNTIQFNGVTSTTYLNNNWVIATVSGPVVTFPCLVAGTPGGTPVATIVNYLVNPPETFTTLGNASFIDLGFEGGTPNPDGAFDGTVNIPNYSTGIFRFLGVNTGSTPYNVQNSNIRFDRIWARGAQNLFEIQPAVVGQLTSEFHHINCFYTDFAQNCYLNNNPQALNHSMVNCDIAGFGHIFQNGGGDMYFTAGELTIDNDAAPVTSASLSGGTVTLVLPFSPWGVIVGSILTVNATTNGGMFSVTAVTYTGVGSTIKYVAAAAPTGTITASLLPVNIVNAPVTSASLSGGTVTLNLPTSPWGVIVGSPLVVTADTNGGPFAVTGVTYAGASSTIQYSGAAAPTGTITYSLLAFNRYIAYMNGLGSPNPLQIQNFRSELRSNYSAPCYFTRQVIGKCTFQDGLILDQATTNKNQWCFASFGNHIHFQNCEILESGSQLAGPVFALPCMIWNTLNWVQEPGTITWDRCILPWDWSAQCLWYDNGYGGGYFQATNCENGPQGTGGLAFAADFDLIGKWPSVGIYTAWGTGQVFGGQTLGGVQPRTKMFMLKGANMPFPISIGTERQVNLPQYSQIKAIHIRYVGGGYVGLSTNPNYIRITDATYTIVHAYVAIGDGSSNASFDGSIGVATTSDWYMYNVGTAANDRNITLSLGPHTGGASDYAGNTGAGFGGQVWLEYW